MTITVDEQQALVAFLRTLTSNQVDALVSDARSVEVGERGAAGLSARPFAEEQPNEAGKRPYSSWRCSIVAVSYSNIAIPHAKTPLTVCFGCGYDWL